MKRILHSVPLLVLIVFGVSFKVCSAEDKVVPEIKKVLTVKEQVADLIQKLDAEDFDVREAASQALLRIGTPAIAPLKQVLAEEPSAELISRGKPLVEKLVREHEKTNTVEMVVYIRYMAPDENSKDKSIPSEIHIAGTQYKTKAELLSVFTKESLAAKAKDKILSMIIKVDGRAEYSAALKVLEAAMKANISRVKFGTSPSSDDEDAAKDKRLDALDALVPQDEAEEPNK